MTTRKERLEGFAAFALQAQMMQPPKFDDNWKKHKFPTTWATVNYHDCMVVNSFDIAERMLIESEKRNVEP